MNGKYTFWTKNVLFWWGGKSPFSSIFTESVQMTSRCGTSVDLSVSLGGGGVGDIKYVKYIIHKYVKMYLS
jgi:hypothetical protein